jgi:hypothetical protein
MVFFFALACGQQAKHNETNTKSQKTMKTLIADSLF